MTEAQIAEIQALAERAERLVEASLSENTRTRIACGKKAGGPGANGAWASVPTPPARTRRLDCD